MLKFAIDDAFECLAASGSTYTVLLDRKQFELGVYKPLGGDPQQPHTRDELYVILSGRGEFVLGAEQAKVAQGDVVFAPAGAEHRFVDFSDDFSAWVLFFTN